MSQLPEVFLVDDEPVVVSLYGHVVRSRGMVPRSFTNAEDAIAALEDISPALIISDLQMPGMGGFDFCAHLVQHGLKRCPFLFLTGQSDFEVMRLGLRAGGDDFLTKGMPVDALTRRLNVWIASGFRGLPQIVRMRANQIAKNARSDSMPSITELIAAETEIAGDIRMRLEREMAEQRPKYGERLHERLRILGRLTAFTLDTIQDLGRVVRFPDYMMAVPQQMAFPWSRDLSAVYRHFDALLRRDAMRSGFKAGVAAVAGAGE